MLGFLKTILKKLLPIPLLKKAFYIVNKIKISSIDRIIFPEYQIDKIDFQIYRQGYPFKESGTIVNDQLDERVKDYMTYWDNWTQEEFILVLNLRCWIEPRHGWAIVKPNRLVYYSLGISRTMFQRKPSIVDLLRKKHTTKVSHAISLRDTGEENYFHFYNDVLAKLFFLEQENIDVTSTPIIISEKLWNKQYFQFYYGQSTYLKSLSWIIQKEREYIQCDRTIFCKPLTHRNDLWSKLSSPFRNLSARGGNRKIFVTRSKKRLRYLENAVEIERVCNRYNIDVVDADNLDFEEQIELFSRTELIVGIHGAGLTNLIFSNRYCKILEIFPPPDLGYLPYHYIMLASMHGLQYKALIGDPGKVAFSGGFCLSITEFEKELEACL